MKLGMGIMGIAVVVATLVSPVADAAWQDDFIYAAVERWCTICAAATGNSGYFP